MGTPASFKPGQSGNPKGRPKKEWTWSGLIDQVAEEADTKSGKQFKDIVAKKLWEAAASGQLGATDILIKIKGGYAPNKVQFSDPAEEMTDEQLQEETERLEAIIKSRQT